MPPPASPSATRRADLLALQVGGGAVGECGVDGDGEDGACSLVRSWEGYSPVLHFMAA